uniref:Translation elongation factor EF1B beta/delta subunit guanine nucleotide exchange domain-containing protein n=1 Tax=Rhizochromulina marina TaxID=1034831 RepID=A0A7S2RC51_9STRA|mmetsp:Transcript_14106/g.41488  ORF Transcript_14106/g.41488 Transcript_14106/m.41488 type:complete len:394 (+) Transcript_14106:75-1256(+)
METGSSGEDWRAILPSAAEEFSTLEYWQAFFRLRPPSEPFEWYCSVDHFVAAALPLLVQGKGGAERRGAPLLHAGCGNSLLSQRLEAEGLTCLDMDFSLNAFPGAPDCSMERMCGDALRLPFHPCRFSAYVDKGLHDAMMHDSGEDCRRRSGLYFSECWRVLEHSGRLLLVTLAQDHILSLLEAAVEAREQGRALWDSVSVHYLVKPQEAHSPLQPFLLCFTKPPPTMSGLELEDGGVVAPVLELSGAPMPSWQALTEAIRRDKETFANVFSSRDAMVPNGLGTATARLVVVDILPEGLSTDLEEIRASVLARPQPPRVIKTELLPVAFGLHKLRVSCVVPDAASPHQRQDGCGGASGEVDLLDSTLLWMEELDGVSGVDVVDVTPCSLKKPQ